MKEQGNPAPGSGRSYFGDPGSIGAVAGAFAAIRDRRGRQPAGQMPVPAQNAEPQAAASAALIPVPRTSFLLDGITRVGVKLALNALSTCTMVRMGRVMGNTMIWVVPSNLKLIDRATRYIERLTGLDYESSNRLLFEVIEYIEPRMKTDRAYPPAVGLAVTRARHHLANEEAEARFRKDIASAVT